ncbi:MAG TPA: hypothetical protein PKN96_09765 [Flavobacterium sp.]|uniref:capsular polysaccharide export protein, LipB/KpsS family n=1 Tax=Flavobacterium sp. TaxID=239 RepID=UPI002CCA199A|nr:hypothetical protein [Flavobacterium sp.]HNP33567.1 hypothetical protein [Flavobacterium sp.]
MNIAFFTNYIYTPHFETELELIQLHLDKGDTVYHFVCDLHLLSCDFNPNADLLKCISCKTKREKGQELLSGKKHYHEIRISNFDYKGVFGLPQLKFNSIPDLRKYKIDNFEIGEATLSSMVSIVRDPAPDLEVYESLMKRIIQSSYYCYYYFQKQLQHYAIDTFYNFNGRFATNRAALRAAQKIQVHTYMHERGRNFQTYELFDNVLPHQIGPFMERVSEAWKNHPDIEGKNRIAHEFYKNRANGKEQSWISFTKDQKKGLPDNWDQNADNVVIFTSSEDEYVSIGKDWEMGFFESQNQLILKLMNDERLAEKKIWVRLHPNMRSMSKQYLKKTYATLQGRIEVILPESPINSYDLIFATNKVLSFGSTVGIEATYWGKPSILLGPSFYKAFDATYNPESYEALVTLLLDKNLKPLAQENTLPYGFHINNFGIPFRIYKPVNLFEGTYKNVNLDKVFNYNKWHKLINTKGFHWLYNRLNKSNHTSRLKRYV